MIQPSVKSNQSDLVVMLVTWGAFAIGMLIWILCSGCGIEAPTNVPPECDTYNYFIDFQKHDRASVVELTCHNANNFAVWTIYTDTAGTTVYYLANSKPVRIESTAAPSCITDKYTELVPDPAVFAMKDCTTRDISPMTQQHLPDGNSCDENYECASGICVGLLPIPRGGTCTIYGITAPLCKQVLIRDTWAAAICKIHGMTVSYCPRETVRCISPMPPAGATPYQCCETTLFE